MKCGKFECLDWKHCMYVSLSSYSMHHCMISPFLSPQPVAEVCRCVVHALLYMVVSLFSEDSLGDLKVGENVSKQCRSARPVRHKSYVAEQRALQYQKLQS